MSRFFNVDKRSRCETRRERHCLKLSAADEKYLLHRKNIMIPEEIEGGGVYDYQNDLSPVRREHGN